MPPGPRAPPAQPTRHPGDTNEVALSDYGCELRCSRSRCGFIKGLPCGFCKHFTPRTTDVDSVVLRDGDDGACAWPVEEKIAQHTGLVEGRIRGG